MLPAKMLYNCRSVMYSSTNSDEGEDMNVAHDCFMPPGVGCPSCTCPDCGVIGQPFVCGSPEDPSGGADCESREAANWSRRFADPNDSINICDEPDCGKPIFSDGTTQADNDYHPDYCEAHDAG